MTSANSGVIFVLITNRSNWLGTIWIVMRLVKISAFDLGPLYIRVLDEAYELTPPEV